MIDEIDFLAESVFDDFGATADTTRRKKGRPKKPIDSLEKDTKVKYIRDDFKRLEETIKTLNLHSSDIKVSLNYGGVARSKVLFSSDEETVEDDSNLRSVIFRLVEWQNMFLVGQPAVDWLLSNKCLNHDIKGYRVKQAKLALQEIASKSLKIVKMEPTIKQKVAKAAIVSPIHLIPEICSRGIINDCLFERSLQTRKRRRSDSAETGKEKIKSHRQQLSNIDTKEGNGIEHLAWLKGPLREDNISDEFDHLPTHEKTIECTLSGDGRVSNSRHYTLISIALNCQNQSNSSSDVYSLGLVDMPESREVAEYLFSNLIPELKSVQESSLQIVYNECLCSALDSILLPIGNSPRLYLVSIKLIVITFVFSAYFTPS